MRIQYRRTFSQFIDTYLSTYYGQNALVRILGGPTLIVAGGIMLVFSGREEYGWLLRGALILVGGIILVRGLMIMLRPLLNVFLVWLRRDEFLGEENAKTTIELHEDRVTVSDADGDIEMPLENILTVSHRTDGAWIVTNSDNIIYVPREDLLEGDHDKFVEALEIAITPDEEEEH
ncbi:MAG: hypothetical protein DWQ07_04850 [Chloroflexi bacterium]|nr:MAG: hypothetical protein DWQ07_04850 [Chloroflexota bacterium]MBL1194760.1 hypothetical protein [Chloroflexota bacterium]NOH12052.1 hypothetical protein [Chloroflexota bacterium]